MRLRKLLRLTCALWLAPGAAIANEVFQAVPGMGGPTQIEGFPIEFILDDGTNENNIGLNNTSAGTATQFMWFNRFDLDPLDLPLQIQQVRIFWDPTPTGAAQVGNAISIEIYSDSDATPNNGATHVHTKYATIAQVGTSFDIYDYGNLSVPVITSTAVNLLVGVVDRWITSGVSTRSFPTAIDQTPPNNGRSWVASYASGTPPKPPTMPSDGLFGTIDSFGLPGDWMIRAAVPVIPVELQSFSIE